MPSSSSPPSAPGPGPAQDAALAAGSSTTLEARSSTLLSPRQRALEEASNELSLGSLSLSSSSSSTPATNPHGARLDLTSLLASEKVYKEVVATAYPCSVGKARSQNDRNESNRHEANLTYGEVQFRSMAFILEKIRQEYGKPVTCRKSDDQEEQILEDGVMQVPRKDVLYDIGSGTGKPCFAAAAIFPFRKVVGIEVLGSLHETALEIQAKWEAEAVPALAAARRKGKDKETGEIKDEDEEAEGDRLEFLQGDFRDMSLCDWPSEATIAIANSTCFSAELMQELAGLAAGMRKGCIFVTLTKRLPSPEHWEVVDDTLMMMSWGGATVYTQRKKTPPASTYRPAAK